MGSFKAQSPWTETRLAGTLSVSASGLRSLMLFWDLGGFPSHIYIIRINVKTARRRTASCSKDNLFAFQLGTLKYLMKTVKEIAPAATWTIPRARAQYAEQTPPFITFYFKRGLCQIVRRVQLPFRCQAKKVMLRLSELGTGL